MKPANSQVEVIEVSCGVSVAIAEVTGPYGLWPICGAVVIRRRARLRVQCLSNLPHQELIILCKRKSHSCSLLVCRIHHSSSSP
eukprot:492617-Prymnesium_polylepis.3